MERAVAQVELRDVVAELADVARQREALVVEQPVPRNYAVRLHADKLKRELTRARAWWRR